MNCPTFTTPEEAALYQAKTGSGVAIDLTQGRVEVPGEPQDARNTSSACQPSGAVVTTDYSDQEKRILAAFAYGGEPDVVFKDSVLHYKYLRPGESKDDLQKRLYESLFTTSKVRKSDFSAQYLNSFMGDLKVEGTRTGRTSFSDPLRQDVKENPCSEESLTGKKIQDASEYVNWLGSRVKVKPILKGEGIRGLRGTRFWYDEGYTGITVPVTDPKPAPSPTDRWKDAEELNESLKSEQSDVADVALYGRRPDYRGSAYLSDYMEGSKLADVLKGAIRACKALEFEAFAYRGMSGGLLAPALAAALGKDLIMCRKTGENSHSSRRTEGRADRVRYIIVDDFICTGETVNVIMKQIAEDMHPESKCVGIVEYQRMDDNTGKFTAHDESAIPKLRDPGEHPATD